MRVANDAEVRVQVYCRILLVVGCRCNNDAGEVLYITLTSNRFLVIKLKCIPSYDGRLPEKLGNTIYTINIAGGSPSFVLTTEKKGDADRVRRVIRKGKDKRK